MMRLPSRGALQDPSAAFDQQPEPTPAAEPTLNNPSAFTAKPGPVGARLLAEGGEAPMAPVSMPTAGMSPAHALAQPVAMPVSQPAQAGQTTEPEWMTPERKAMRLKAREAAKRYKQAVDQRRMTRKHQSEYSKLYGQLERHIGSAEDLANLQQNYPELYTADSPQTMGLVRTQAQHVEAAERIKQQLRQHLKKSGVKIGDKDQLPDNPFGLPEDDDRQFDSQMMQGFTDALTTPYSEQ